MGIHQGTKGVGLNVWIYFTCCHSKWAQIIFIISHDDSYLPRIGTDICAWHSLNMRTKWWSSCGLASAITDEVPRAEISTSTTSSSSYSSSSMTELRKQLTLLSISQTHICQSLKSLSEPARIHHVSSFSPFYILVLVSSSFFANRYSNERKAQVWFALYNFLFHWRNPPWVW